MEPAQLNVGDLRRELEEIRAQAAQYFQVLDAQLKETALEKHAVKYASEHWYYVSEENKRLSSALLDRIKETSLRIMQATKLSPLMAEADEKEIRILTRQLSAALQLGAYRSWDAQMLHDEDVVLGVKPAGQEEHKVTIDEARRLFYEGLESLQRLVFFISPDERQGGPVLVAAHAPADARYTRNTAFIMMWMSTEHPELEDVNSCFKDVFREFGVEARRSDDIEHQDVVTSRILQEISTSEFLIADLTGERPSVYYEVGYAHAAGKRPILFRKKGTPLHFDLAVHNVPEYANITDLRRKLRNRLGAIMNRQI